MSSRTLPLKDHGMYHVCNRAIGSEVLFLQRGCYLKFLKNLNEYLLPQVDLWSYCLLPNHFHLLFRVGETVTGSAVSKGIADCCNAYSKWFNVRYSRKGNLFMRPFRRIEIENDHHLAWTVWYIHRNPLHHYLVRRLTDWPFSSYNAIVSDSYTRVARAQVLDFFGGTEQFIRFHGEQLSGGFARPDY